jgi:hypothetical protein
MGASVDRVHALVLAKVVFFFEAKRSLTLPRRNAITTNRPDGYNDRMEARENGLHR